MVGSFYYRPRQVIIFGCRFVTERIGNSNLITQAVIFIRRFKRNFLFVTPVFFHDAPACSVIFSSFFRHTVTFLVLFNPDRKIPVVIFVNRTVL
ncbi:hypothetical protein Barb6_02966 [Bacteroidales bacterium Barb6]|nr:hypothetical protein Barb6_02966 [Bacteroidales bacterium Barb6]